MADELILLCFVLLGMLGFFAVRQVCDSCDCGLCVQVCRRRTKVVPRMELPTPPRRAYVLVETPGKETFVGLNDIPN